MLLNTLGKKDHEDETRPTKYWWLLKPDDEHKGMYCTLFTFECVWNFPWEKGKTCTHTSIHILKILQIKVKHNKLFIPSVRTMILTW